MLVGDGARKWARDRNIEEVEDDYLKTGKNFIFKIYYFNSKYI